MRQDVLQRTIEAEFDKIPALIAKRIFKKKLIENGLETPAALLDAMVDHFIINKSSDTFCWNFDDGDTQDKEIKFEFTQDDFEELDTITDRLLNHDIPRIIEDLVEPAALETIASLKADWEQQKAYEVEVFSGFRERLDSRYAAAFDSLRIFLTASREWGLIFHSSESEFKIQNPTLALLLTHLHARSCQVAAEITVLIENGFADGALARWRTLHEISIVAILLHEHGEETACRYNDFDAIESKNALKKYLSVYEALGFKAPTEVDIKAIQKAADDVVEKHGLEMMGWRGYGWAAKALSKPNPSFADLEASAGQSVMRSHYNLASYAVHAGVKGIYFKLGVEDGSDVILAGASDVGFTESAQNMAVTLNIINALLLLDQPNMDEIVMMKVLEIFGREVVNEFSKFA